MNERRKYPICVMNTTLEHLEALEAMQRIVFHTLTDEELFTVAKYRKHLELFPEGQFVAIADVDGEEVIVGATTTFRTTWDIAETQHTFLEAIAGGWLTNHNPKGDWLYGADVSVLPDFRRMGVGSRLYDARRELVRRLNLRGEIAGGMIPGYEHYKDQLEVEEYVKGVVEGTLRGQTLAMQLKNGFVPRGILQNHITDPRADDYAVLIVRENPHYRDEA